MKFLDIQSAVGTAVLLWALPSDAKHGRGLSHMETFGKRHQHQKLHLSPRVEKLETTLATRGGSCQFPSDAGLFAVTPGSKNAGWAMSPDQTCEPGSYCPYACPSGQVMAQWDPSATSYTYPGSMVCKNGKHKSKLTNHCLERGSFLRQERFSQQTFPQQAILR